MTACACLQMTMTPITVIAACCLAEALSSWTMSASITLWREGRGKKYIACENPKTADENFDVVIPRLKAEAERRTNMMVAEERRTNERKRMARLEMMKTAVPFKSGMRWD